MSPRTHNLVSYGVTCVVFGVVLSIRTVNDVLAPAALIGAAMWGFHFVRRTLEAAWVHRYGKGRVPLSDVVTEYVYYWGFATWNAWSVTSPWYRGPAEWQLGLGIGVFLLAEWGNAKAHRMLRDLRPPGSKERVIPRGFLFERVSCPHYTFEILSWVGFALVTGTWAALAFLCVGAAILGAWARSRHLAYRKDFDGLEGREAYPASRRALLPGLF